MRPIVRARWSFLFTLLLSLAFLSCLPEAHKPLDPEPFGEVAKQKPDLKSYILVTSAQWHQATIYVDDKRALGRVEMSETRMFRIPDGVFADGAACFSVRLLGGETYDLGCDKAGLGDDFEMSVMPSLRMSWVVVR